jgi:prolyl oligopeptidase
MKIETREDDLIEELHGTKVPDPYRWLEGDPNGPELHDWLTKQAKAASGYFSSLSIRNSIRDELKELAEYDSFGHIIPRNGRYFYTRREAKQDMSVLYVREGLAGEERVLIDPNTLSPDKTTVLSGWAPSRDGKWLTYGISKSANDKKYLHILNVDSGKTLDDFIPDDLYPYMDSWSADSTGFWYSRRDPDAPENEPKFHKRLYFHKIGTVSHEDLYVWGKGFAREWRPSTSLSYDGKYQVGTIHGQEDGENWSEVYIREVDSHSDFTLVIKRVLGAEFEGWIHRDNLYISTNDGAPRWKLMATPIEKALAGTPEFTDVLPESEDVLENYKFIGDKLFAGYIHNVQSSLVEYTLEGRLVKKIELPGIGTAGGFSGEAEGKEFFYSFTSFVYSPTLFRMDLETGSAEVFHETKATFDTKDIMTEQVWFTSKDGTKIPMFLVYRKDLQKNGNNPTMLYGYGGFDISLRPVYTTNPIPLIKRGGIYAVVNLRGGGEFGREWHEAGMKKHKQNVFDDFIAAAEYLISEKYTSKEKLAIMGGSNGGLLVSTVETQRPDLVQAVVCRVPVADMLRYHLHHGGRHWIPDFGDPDNADMFAYLLGYSPYHNVKDGEKYPATLIMTSDGDDRVHPLHAYKLAARLQEANASENSILMRVEMKAGHGGAQAVSRAVEQEADMWSFVFDQLKVS